MARADGCGRDVPRDFGIWLGNCKGGPMRSAVGLLLTVLVGMAFYWHTGKKIQQARDDYRDVAYTEHGLRRCDGHGEVSRIQPTTSGERLLLARTTLRCDGWSWPRENVSLFLQSTTSHWRRGDTVQFVADVAPTELPRGLELESPWPRVARTGAFRSGSALLLSRISSGRGPLAWLDAMRDDARQQLVRGMPADVLPLALALVTGAAPDDAALQEDFRVSGLAHLLAVSGAHLTLVVGGLVAAMRRVFGLLRPIAARHDTGRAAALLGAILAPAYADLSGGSGSAWRAASMSSLSLLAIAAGVRLRPAVCFLAGAMLLGSCDPLLLFDRGTQLSLLASGALLCAPLLMPGMVATRMLQPLWTQICVTAAVAPLIFHMSARWSWCSVALNLLAIPFGETVALPAALLSSVLGKLAILGPVAIRLAAGSLRVLAWLAHVGATHGVLQSPAPLGLLHRPTAQLEVRQLDVGQGDAALIRTPSGQVLLIDVGGRVGPGPNPGERVIAPTLRQLGVSHVNVVIISHPHPDHEAGLAAAVRDVQVSELWDSGEAADSQRPKDYLDTLHALEQRGTKLRRAKDICGTHMLGLLQVEVLAPCGRDAWHQNSNDNSLVVRLQYGSTRFLFVGDAEEEQERELLALPIDLSADVLKVGHHGSRTSTHLSFLARVRPRIASVSSGVRNRFGHPTAAALERLQAQGPIAIFRTDICGETIWRTDGHRLETQVAEPSCLQSVFAPEAPNLALHPQGVSIQSRGDAREGEAK